ncbi:response regulator [Tengunoibacter tsumagoiensis]|uniref:DNA-binding response regulator n=1 Tax=Tengunoibacter tsumagoiensis TaxID=2014871 RepID=A0A402A1G4_9CHLR|nr:response regulator transcription factor [Tengunoibacter tsumagoiensis]GCE12988.1 DNA-binding response regulator [Tengunoibacter tsumagoiensis]
MQIEANSGEKMISVLLADDHDILRQGLRLLFKAQPDMRVVGEARTGGEAIAQARALRPAIVVLDISMAQMDGLTACKHIRRELPQTQVLILTMHEREEYFLQALRVGAAGYLVKKAAPAELSSAVRAVAQGEMYLYPGLARALVRAYLAPHHAQAGESPRGQTLPNALQVLTPREIEVLTLVAEGKTNQEIATLLVLSIKTVQAHRANVMEKLGLQDITHLVRFAIHHGLIDPEP